MRRLQDESTMAYLSRTLVDLKLYDMARRARLGHFDDYFCPPEIDDGGNINRLVNELRKNATRMSRNDAIRIQEVMDAAMNGEFDGTKEEADQWEKSPDGQATFNELLKGRRDETDA